MFSAQRFPYVEGAEWGDMHRVHCYSQSKGGKNKDEWGCFGLRLGYDPQRHRARLRPAKRLMLITPISPLSGA